MTFVQFVNKEGLLSSHFWCKVRMIQTANNQNMLMLVTGRIFVTIWVVSMI